MNANATILVGDVLDRMRGLADQSVQCVVTSPPYWGLRNYGVEGQLGLEKTPEEYVAKMVEVFREVRRVLREDGTLWLNIGDSYNAAGRDGHGTRAGCKQGTNRASANGSDHARPTAPSLKPKDLVGIPWLLAFALRADGWWLRQDIIWSKPNPMPESVTDRCTKSHEYIFLMSKSPRYYFDQEAIKEPMIADHPAGNNSHKGATAYNEGDEKHRTKKGLIAYAQKGRTGKNAFRGQGANRSSKTGPANRDGREMKEIGAGEKRNKRDVWWVGTQPFSEAHFATFPDELIEPCILAGCPEGGVVLDPFCGSGTTGVVALRYGRNFVGIELSPTYAELSERRINKEAPLLNKVEVVA